MSHLNDLPHPLLQFFFTAPHACAYLPGRIARSQVATPSYLIDTEVYGELIRQGFRRSGVHAYRPWCESCKACVPVRVPVDRFEPDRSMKRAWARHSGLHAMERELEFDPEHFALYRLYQNRRHTGGGMDEDGQEQYIQFMLQSGLDTRLIEFREAGVLRMVSLIDCLPDGLSSVYTFFNPNEAKNSYGAYGILWQIAASQRMGLPYVYLGYWIRDCRKMSYKQRYRPIEGFIDEAWRELREEDF